MIAPASGNQCVFRLGAAEDPMLDAHAINDLFAFADALIWLASLGRNVVANFFMLLARHAVARFADLPRHACEREKRSVKCRRTEQMIRMVMRDIEPGERLFQFDRIARDLACVRKCVLRVDHVELRWQLDDVRRDEPTLFGRRERMDGRKCVGYDSPCARHGDLLWPLAEAALPSFSDSSAVVVATSK